MRKKFLLTTIIILMLGCCVATSFAWDDNHSSTTTDENQFKMNTVVPSDMYMPLLAPQLVAVNDKYTVAVSASESEIAVYSNGDYNKIPTTIQEGYFPKAVAIVGDNLLVMYERSILPDSILNLWNLSTGKVVNVDFQEVLGEGKNALRIDEDDLNFYIHNTGNELIEMTMTGESVVYEKLSVPIATMARATLFDMSGGQLYVYKDNAICQVSDGAPIFSCANITRFKVLDGAIMYVVGGEIHYYLTDTATELTPFDTSSADNAKSCYAYDGRIYYCDSTANRVKVLELGAAVTDNGKYYGDSGDAIGRYNAPQDVVASGGNVYVADTENSRISVYNIETNVVSVASLGSIKPLKIAVNCENIAVYDGTSVGVYKYEAEQLKLIAAMPTVQGGIVSMVYHYDRLIVLTDGGIVYEMKNSSDNILAEKIYENANARQLVANSNSNYIYILTDKLVKLNMTTFAEEPTYEIDLTNATSIAIDYAGSAYCLSSGGIELNTYSRSGGVYAHKSKYDMDRLRDNTRMAMDMQSGDIYIVDKDMHKLSVIGGKGIGAVSLNDIGYDHAPKEQWTVVEAGEIIADTVLYAAPNNDEAVENISANNVFLVLAKVECGGKQLAYGTVKGGKDKLCYIELSSLKMYSRVDYPESHGAMTAVFPSGAVVREFPMRSAKILTYAKRPTELKLINNVAGGEGSAQVWQWYKVACKSQDGADIVGYVEVNDVYYTSVITPPTNRVFLKVQTEGLGKTIKMYKEPNAESEVLSGSIADGEKVILCESVFNGESEFTKVSYDNQVGYIYTSQLLQSGLTATQVTTVVVATVCVVIFVVLVVLLILRKKLFKKSNDKR